MAFVRLSPVSPRRTIDTTALSQITEVLECHHVTDADCYLVKVAAADTGHLEQVVEALSHIGKTTTSIVLSTPIAARPAIP